MNPIGYAPKFSDPSELSFIIEHLGGAQIIHWPEIIIVFTSIVPY